MEEVMLDENGDGFFGEMCREIDSCDCEEATEE